MVKCIKLFELMLQDAPQLIIQPLNNEWTNSWNKFEVVSVVLTVFAFLIELFFIFYNPFEISCPTK